MNLEEKVSRAKEAEAILNNRLVAGAHKEIEDAIVEALAVCPARDKEGQHELMLQLQANRRHKAIFARHIDTGKLAAKELSLLDKIKAKTQLRFG